jgi:hypothetical protein
METSLTERLTECLRRKKADYMTLGSLPGPLKKRLTGKTGPSAAELKKHITPHLGENLMLKQGGRYAYLAFRQPDETLLLHIIMKRAGKTPSANNTPFKKEEFLAVLNRLIEQGKVFVKINKDYKPVLSPALLPALCPAPDAGEGEAGEKVGEKKAENGQEDGRKSVSEEEFGNAYRELEGGKFFVRVCDLRRRLGWTEREFDGMAAALRDAGKIQLQAGDTAYFDEKDIADSFVDENGFRMLTLMWRG